MVEVLRSDYIRTAHAKGLASRTVVLRHAFRNASLPLVTMLGPIAVNMLVGSFFIEAIFRIPGIGAQMTLATYNRDYPVIMALALLWTFVLALAYLLSDLMYAWVDPRIRLRAKGLVRMATIATQAPPAATLAKPFKQRNLWSDAARRFARNRLSMVALVIILLLVLMAIFADLLAPEGYDKQVYSEAWQSPSWQYPLGTDPFGRSLLSRIIHGARISLLVGLVSMVFSLLIGLPIGAASAWFGGAVDYFFMRLIDVISAVPNLLLAILIVTVLGSGLRNVLLVLILTGWMGMARLVRGQLLSIRESDYVLAARCHRRARLAHHQPPSAAQRALAHHRRRHAGHSRRNPGRSRIELSGRRRQPPAAELGAHGQ